MNRIYHPYWTWEDIGMWRDVSEYEHRRYLILAVDFTSDACRYGAAMLDVLRVMPRACDHNLTESSMNRQAWIGHAACFLAIGCPEYITREAWGQLTQRQRDDANTQADCAISEWEKLHAAEARKLHPQLDFEGLPGWSA